MQNHGVSVVSYQTKAMRGEKSRAQRKIKIEKAQNGRALCVTGRDVTLEMV